MSWYDWTVVVLGWALLGAAGHTLVTGRWPIRSESVPRPRWMGVWALCLGIYGVAHIPQFEGFPSTWCWVLSCVAAFLGQRPAKPRAADPVVPSKRVR